MLKVDEMVAVMGKLKVRCSVQMKAVMSVDYLVEQKGEMKVEWRVNQLADTLAE